MIDASETIKTLIAPVVMISACGLLCLALYNRMASIVGRARVFHKERFDAASREAALSGASPEEKRAKAELRKRIATLEDQGAQILRRARLIRNALFCLIVTVMCMILCSLLLGLTGLNKAFAVSALAAFVVGMLSMLAGMILATVELGRALDPVAVEHARLSEDKTAAQAQ